MNDPKFTPGPWRTVEDAQGICGIMDPTKQGVAVAWLSSSYEPMNGYIGEASPEIGSPERQANAHLIEVAPGMYAQLERVRSAISCFWSGDIRDELMAEITALLAKARGEVQDEGRKRT